MVSTRLMQNFLRNGVAKMLVEIRPFRCSKIHIFYKSSPPNPYGQVRHQKISILAKSQPPNPKLRPKNAQNTFQNPSTSHLTLHLPFKIKELGLLTFIFVRSATRRFLWCNSHLLIPKLRYKNGRFTFLLVARIPARVAKIISEKIDFSHP